MVATMKNKKDIAQLLIDNGANINAQRYNGWTPLMLAVGIKNIDMVKFLLDNNADITIKNNSNKTALDIARSRNYEEIVALFENYTK